MRRILSSLGAIALAVPTASAQSRNLDATAPANPPAPVVTQPIAPVPSSPLLPAQYITPAVMPGTTSYPTSLGTTYPPIEYSPSVRDPFVWFSADYMLYRVKASPVPFPVLTQGDDRDRIPGGLGQPGTRILFGNGAVGYPSGSGLKLYGGFMVGNGLGLEGGGFAINNRSKTTTFSSDASGRPDLGQPVFFTPNPAVFINQPGSDGNYGFAIPNTLAGSIGITTDLELSGWEVNLAFPTTSTDGRNTTFLLGYRQISLDESLTISATTRDLNGGFLTFRGTALAQNDRETTSDTFRTRNDFYGPQIGARVHQQFGPRFGLDFVGKLAMGVSSQRAEVSGSSTFTPANGVGGETVQGGIYAQTTNIGVYTREQFAVAPEGNLSLFFNLTESARIRVGYDFLYISRVARPGTLVDRRIEATRVAIDPAFNGAPPLSNNPAFQWSESSFYAHGVRFGFELAY